MSRFAWEKNQFEIKLSCFCFFCRQFNSWGGDCNDHRWRYFDNCAHRHVQVSPHFLFFVCCCCFCYSGRPASWKIVECKNVICWYCFVELFLWIGPKFAKFDKLIYLIYFFYQNLCSVFGSLIIPDLQSISFASLYRQYRLERELTSQLWKVSSYELSFRDWRSSQTSVGSFVSCVSIKHNHFNCWHWTTLYISTADIELSCK